MWLKVVEDTIFEILFWILHKKTEKFIKIQLLLFLYGLIMILIISIFTKTMRWIN